MLSTFPLKLSLFSPFWTVTEKERERENKLGEGGLKQIELEINLTELHGTYFWLNMIRMRIFGSFSPLLSTETWHIAITSMPKSMDGGCVHIPVLNCSKVVPFHCLSISICLVWCGYCMPTSMGWDYEWTSLSKRQIKIWIKASLG